jgi:hypothetical protein
MLIHGAEESYKSTLILQIAESISLARPLIRQWGVTQERRVGIIETEMHPASMGERLLRMFPTERAPEGMVFLGDRLLRQWRRQDLSGKFRLIEEWIAGEGIQVLIVDTANDFFRGKHNAGLEGDVGEFFDLLRNLPLEAKILVRHDRKQRVALDGNPNDLIRGSAEWKEDPETILHIRRKDRRTHQAILEVGKLRYGRKPEEQTLWFDADCSRLTPLLPVIAILEGRVTKKRQEIVTEAGRRFGLSERSLDTMLAEQGHLLDQGADGHTVTFRLKDDLNQDAVLEYLTEASVG